MIIGVDGNCDFVMGCGHIDDILVLHRTRPRNSHYPICSYRNHVDIGCLPPIGHLFVQIEVSFGGTKTLLTIFDHPRHIKRHFQ